MNILVVPALRPAEALVEPERLIDLLAENDGLRAALAVAEGAGIQRELVSQELKHRIGNLLTVVQAIARKTFAHADAASVEDSRRDLVLWRRRKRY